MIVKAKFNCVHTTSTPGGNKEINMLAVYGTEGENDLSGEIQGPVFEPLQDVVYFPTLRVTPDTGTIE